MTKQQQQLLNPSWDNRRVFLWVTQLYLMALASYIIVMDVQSELAQEIATLAVFMIASNVACYVLGATWQDISLRSKFSPFSRKEPTN